MGKLTSSITSEIYLKYNENIKILDILLKSYIIGYFHYVDDILIIYKNGIPNIHDVLIVFNNITPMMKFTMEEENDKKNQFFGHYLLQRRQKHIIQYTQKTICNRHHNPSDSYPLPEHKFVAIRHLTD